VSYDAMAAVVVNGLKYTEHISYTTRAIHTCPLACESAYIILSGKAGCIIFMI